MLESIVPRYRKLLMLVWCQGFLNPPSQRCLAFPCALYKIGNKVAVSPQVQQKPSSVLRNVTLKCCKNSLREAVRPNPAVQGTLRDEAAQRRLPLR